MKAPTSLSRLRAPDAKSAVILRFQASTPSVAASLALALAILAAGADTPGASAQAVAYAGPGAVNFTSANVCPSGKTAPAPCSKTLALTYNVTASGTLGTPRVLTAGAPDLDYKLAGGSTCAGSVAKGSTCQVNVAFAPLQPGARDGAVEIVDNRGNALATTYIYGTGIGPRATFAPAAQITVGGSDSPYIGGPVAVDGYGNLFIASPRTQGQDGTVEELLAVNGTLPVKPVVKILAQTTGYMASATSLAVDGAGNLFFSVAGYPGVAGYVQELLAAGGYAASSSVGGAFFFAHPYSLAVDGSGNVFVSSTMTGDDITYPGGIYEIPAAGGYATVDTLGDGYESDPYAIALDASGNLFVSNAAFNTDGGGNIGNVLELSPADNYSSVRVLNVTFEQFNTPLAIAVDPAGDLFAAYPVGSSLTEYLAINGILPANPASLLFGQFTQPYELAFDGSGDFYVADEAGLHELQSSTPSTLAFAQTIVGQTSTDSPQSMQIQNQGNAALDLSGLSLDSANWQLVKGSGVPEDCAAGIGLAPSALCNLSISFKPTDGGLLTGAIAVADNSLNSPGAQQAIPLQGFGETLAPPEITGLNTNYAAPYSVVILSGDNFGATQGSSAVAFNSIPAPRCHWSNTKIYVTVPPNAVTGDIVVSVGGELSNAVAFTVVPMPVLTGISPTSGPPGTIVAINGQNFLDLRLNPTVTFNGKSLPVISQSRTALTVAVPAAAVSGDFHIVVNDTGMNSPAFTVTP
jgi:hypothetical protein